jgi:regulator of nucleoside diphosphate kinase
MTQRDETRLRALIASINSNEGKLLKDLLDSARIVPSEQISRNIVTMNSRIRLKDLESGQVSELDLVFPHDVNDNRDALSILSLNGTALFGLSEGDSFTWTETNGHGRTLKILSVLWQPEAEGLFQF